MAVHHHIDEKRDGIDGYRCLAHDTWFSRLGTCPGCDVDPGDPGDDVELEYNPVGARSAPAGCANSLSHEIWLTNLSDEIKETAKKLCHGKGRINYATAAKLFDTAIKSRRAAAELAREREHEIIVTERERRMREMKQGPRDDRATRNMVRRAAELRERGGN